MFLAVYLAACQPIQAPPDATGGDTAAAATTAAATESVTSTVTATVTDQVTGSVGETVGETLTQTASVSATTPISPPASVPVAAAPQPVAEVISNDAQTAAGLAVYRAQYCGVCHTLDAAGTRGTFAPNHNDMGAVAAARVADPSYSGHATTPLEYIIESIVDPQAYVVPAYALSSHRMPAYVHLSTEELEALAAFLLAQ